MDKVIVPVALDTMTWFAVPMSEVTPEFVIVALVVPVIDTPVPWVSKEAIF